MKRKLTIFMVLAASIMLVLSACSSNDNSEGSGDSDEPLKVWGMGAEGKKLDEIAKDFEEETGIKVDVQSLPWGKAKDKVLTAVASKKGPDILQQPQTWIPQFAESNTYMDLSDFFNDDDYPNLKKDRFNKKAMESVEMDGKIQAMPWFVATGVMFYRTDLLEEVGYPDGPETQEDLLDAARKLTERDGGEFGLGIPPEDFNLMFMYAIRQGWTYDKSKGAENFKDPGFKEMMELYQTMFKEGLAPVQDQGKESPVALADGSQPIMFSGPFMVNLINEQVPDLEGDWTVKTVPEAENGDNFIGGTQLAVFHNTDKEEKAAKFLNYMADTETQVDWFKSSNSLPAVEEAWEDPAIADDEKLKVFSEQLDKTQLPPLIPEYEQLGDELVNTMEKVIREKIDLEEAVDEYYEKASDILSD